MISYETADRAVRITDLALEFIEKVDGAREALVALNETGGPFTEEACAAIGDELVAAVVAVSDLTETACSAIRPAPRPV